MKKIMFVTLALSFVLSLWIIKGGWAKQSNPNDIGQRQQKNLFDINVWGTLKVVRNKEGKEIFGPGRPPNEGYSIAYQRLNPTTYKPIEAPKVFFADGDHSSEKRLLCEECEKRRKRERDQAVATVTTTDGVLRINSDFYFLEKEGKLKIVRTIENISNYPVQLISIRAQYDARLGSNKATQFGKDKSYKGHKTAQTQPQFSPSNAFGSGFWTPAAPLFHPSCDPCPPQCDLSLIASAGEKELICVECPKDGSSILEYMAISVPVGQYPQAVIDKQRANGECDHPIIVDVWNGNVIADGKLRNLGEGDIICVDCPKTGGQTLIVQPVSGRGGAIDPTRNLRNSGLCQLAIDVAKGGSLVTNPKTSVAKDGQLDPGEQQAVVVILDTER